MERVNYSQLPREERGKIAETLIYKNTNSDKEYRAVINYLRLKCPEMQKGNHKIDWKYKIANDRVNTTDLVNNKTFDMSASVCYDPKTMEPVGFSGIYYSSSKEYGTIARGIVTYVDENYRGMGIAQTFHAIQEEKMRRCNVKYCYETQLNGNIQQLSEKNGYTLLSKGSLCKDGTYSQVRYLIDVQIAESIERYNNLVKSKGIEWDSPLDFTFLKNKYNLLSRKPFTIDELNEPWKNS